jgi:hypothetical protein
MKKTKPILLLLSSKELISSHPLKKGNRLLTLEINNNINKNNKNLKRKCKNKR